MIIEQRFTLEAGDRLQIKLSKGFEESVVAAAFRLLPLLMRVIAVRRGGNEADVIVHVPRGITIANLSASERRKPYFVDTETDDYSRLMLLRQTTKGIVITGDPDDAVLGSDLAYTRAYPIVIELLSPSDKSDAHFRICAHKTWLVLREEISQYELSGNPLEIPEALLSLLDISKLTVPTSESVRQSLLQRIANVSEITAWYAKKTLSESARETLKLKLAELKDFEIKVALAQHAKGDDSEGGHRLLDALVNVLKDHAGEARAEQWVNEAKEKLGNDNTLKVITSTKLSDFVDAFRGEEAFSVAQELILNEDAPNVPLNNCRKCGSKVGLESKRVAQENGNKLLWFANCSGCDAMSARQDWGNPSQVASSWNKTMGQGYLSAYPALFGFDGIHEQEVRQQLKAINQLVVKMRQALKAAPATVKQALLENDCGERLTKVEMWSKYIKNSLSH